MIIEKLFIKDHNNVEDEKVRTKHGIIAGIFGLFSNILLFTIKLIFGILSASISIIADAINNLSDSASSILTIFSFKIASKPPDEKHPYGHERIEYIISLLIAVLILLIGGSFFIESIKLSIQKVEVKFEIITIIILVISIVIKLYQALFYYKIGKKIKSPVLIASFRDSLSDVLVTTTVLVSTIIYVACGINIDTYIGILVSMFIVYNGIKTIVESSNLLIGELPDKEFVEKLVHSFTKDEKILGYHDLVFHMYGQNKLYASVHLEFDYKENILMIHDIVDAIEKEIYKDFKVEIVIHMDPVITDDEELNNYKRIVTNLIKTQYEDINIHDFRLIRVNNEKKLFFDCAMPVSYKSKYYDIKKDIENRVCDTITDVECHVTVDTIFNYE